jgi:hypothetical protein
VEEELRTRDPKIDTTVDYMNDLDKSDIDI